MLADTVIIAQLSKTKETDYGFETFQIVEVLPVTSTIIKRMREATNTDELYNIYRGLESKMAKYLTMNLTAKVMEKCRLQ